MSYVDTARVVAEKLSQALGVELKTASALALGDTEAYMYVGRGYELTVRCGPCGCEAMLRRDDEPLAYCGLTCSPDPRAPKRGEAERASRLLEEAMKAAGAPMLREC